MKDFNIKSVDDRLKKNTCPLLKKNLGRNNFSY